MLDEHQIPYRYREYTREPLTQEQLRVLLRRLGVTAASLLRRQDKAFRELGLTGAEDDGTLIPLIAGHPTLLQRPIGIWGERAAVGRPPEKLLDLVDAKSP